jgi:hypothetical protein
MGVPNLVDEVEQLPRTTMTSPAHMFYGWFEGVGEELIIFCGVEGNVDGREVGDMVEREDPDAWV